jgi:hypothetical protein
MISGFRRKVDENCALLRFYAARSGHFLPTFQDNPSVPSSRVKKPLKMGLISCPETSVRNYRYWLYNNSDERSLMFMDPCIVI